MAHGRVCRSKIRFRRLACDSPERLCNYPIFAGEAAENGFLADAGGVQVDDLGGRLVTAPECSVNVPVWSGDAVQGEDVGGVQVGAAGAGGVGPAGFAQGGAHNVAQRGENGRGIAGADVAGVLVEDDVADPVGAVLDGPG